MNFQQQPIRRGRDARRQVPGHQPVAVGGHKLLHDCWRFPRSLQRPNLCQFIRCEYQLGLMAAHNIIVSEIVHDLLERTHERPETEITFEFPIDFAKAML